MSEPARIGVIVPVGPAPAELERLDDTIASLAFHEPAVISDLVLIDDGLAERPLADLVTLPGARISVVRTPLDKARCSPYSAMTAGTLTALAALAEAPVHFVLKLDTDALVINPFADSLMTALSESGAGLIGACDSDGSGRRPRTTWHRTLHRAAYPIRIQRHGTAAPSALRLVVRRPSHVRTVVTTLRASRRRGHEWGRHCLGGAYAISSEAIRHLARSDSLDWRPWTGPAISEDVVISTLAFAAGFDAQDFVADGEVFGITHVGLPDTPENLVRRRFAIIHSVKNDARVSEEEIRAFFRARRV